MTDPRQTRIDRLKSIRGDELDRARALLGEAARTTQEALDAFEMARAKYTKQLDELEESGPTSVEDHAVRRVRIDQLARSVDMARAHVAEVTADEDRARAYVTACSRELKKIELWETSIRDEARLVTTRRERRQQDEFAATRFGRQL